MSETEYITVEDHQKSLAAKDQEIERLKAAVEKYRTAAIYAEDCLNPETDPRSSGMALHKLRAALAFDKQTLGGEGRAP